MSQTIPTLDLPYYTIRVRLDERDYTLEFFYSSREERYHLSLFDSEDRALVCGLKLVTNVALLRSYHHRDGVPPGELVVTASTVDRTPPKIGELGPLDDGKRCQLTYFPAADVEEVRALITSGGAG